MSENKERGSGCDEEMIGVLMAISVVSKRLARRLIQENQTKEEGESHNDRTEHGDQTAP